MNRGHRDAHPNRMTWLVLRQDDNGNVYVVAECETEDEARALARTYEARGHKQLYSVEQRGEPRS